MQIFERDNIHAHCNGTDWPDFLGAVDLDETFVIETERFNLANGPIAIRGVKAGETIAVHVEDIEILPPFFAPNGGPFFEGMGDPIPLEYRDGFFYFPQHFRLQANPSIGNIAVLPTRSEIILNLARTDHLKRGWRRVVNDPRGKHCHQDSRWLTAGACIHLKAQVDEVGLCVADVHGYIGQGELAFAGIEVNANVQLNVTRSTGWLVDWPLIETDDEIMVCCSDTNILRGTTDETFVDVVRRAYSALREVVAARVEGTIEEANTIVATAADLRPCALYGLGNFVQNGSKTSQPDQDIAVTLALPKHVLP
jgi:acetamidase/formamidase